jgi:hypothetical protein
MARKSTIAKIYDAIEERDCKIIGKVVEADGSITFEFAGGFDINMPAGTTDKAAIKRARKNF